MIDHAVFDGAMLMLSKFHCVTDPDPGCDDHSMLVRGEAFETVATFGLPPDSWKAVFVSRVERAFLFRKF